MFYVIGLGLGNEKDVTVKGLEIIRKCQRVYLEAYTSILTVGKETLEKFYERPLILADRELVENESEEILSNSENEDVAFLVVGDPFGATTHTDLVLRAREKGIKTEIVHNASILNAIGCCGLQLYSYGEVVSIPYWTETWQPDSFYEKIGENRKRGLHTLCLLDIKVKEPTLDSIMKKKKEYMPPKFMTVAEAANQLIQIIERKKVVETNLAFDEESLAIGLARVGSEDQKMLACNLFEMRNVELGPPLHCLVIPGEKLHPLEAEFLDQFLMKDENVK